MPNSNPAPDPIPAPAPMPADNGMGFPMPQGPDPSMPPAGPEPDNPYDADFDPGVEADEEEDPKKFIQQLTGKLAQSLRKYNEALPQPDTDLDKYVAGMIIKQATEGLNQEDIQDILDKIEKGEEPEAPGTNADPNMQGTPDSNTTSMPDPKAGQVPPQEGAPMNERSARLDNLYNSFTQEDGTKDKPTQAKRKGFNREPYKAPSWK